MYKVGLFSLIIIIVLVLVLNGNQLLALKQKAGLQVNTDNIPATLFLDDQYLDKSPFIDKKIQPKNYVLRIQPDDSAYASYETPIKLNKGTITVVNWKPKLSLETSSGVIYEMEKLKNNDTQIELQSIPDGAIITMDQGSKQFSPLLVAGVAEGIHEFEVSLPSYETQQHTFNVPKGYRVAITVILGRTTEDLNLDTQQNNQQNTQQETNSKPDLLETTTSTTGPQVQILQTGFFVNDQEVLRVRESASQNALELGFALVGKYYPYLGEITDWLQINFDGQPGWVSAKYSQKIICNQSQIN